MQKIRVGINGYGTIGKRVADAARLQPDMELVGITAHSPKYTIINAYREKKYKIFFLSEEVYRALEEKGVRASGNLDDLLGSVDVVVDCSPKPEGKKNKDIYQSRGLKAVFQGGESEDISPVSFVSQCDWSRAVGKDYLRVVSCNTTGLSRTLHAIDKKYGIEHVYAFLTRRATDSNDHKRGPVNAIVPSFEQPSHHGPDVRTVLPRLEIFTLADEVPTTLMHKHSLMLDMRGHDFIKEDIIELLNSTPRIIILHVDEGIKSTAQVMDYYKDLGRNSRGDMYETGIWDRGIGVYRAHGYNWLFIEQCIHQESNVVPENIDAIRAVMDFDNSRLQDELYRDYKEIVEKERQAYLNGPLHVETDDKMEEINPSRIITDSTLNILKVSSSN